MADYKFQLGDDVITSKGHEAGKVVGRAEFLHSPESYKVAYTKTNGQAYEEWFAISDITHPA